MLARLPLPVLGGCTWIGDGWPGWANWGGPGLGFVARGSGAGAACLVLVGGCVETLAGGGCGPCGRVGITTSTGTGGVALVLLAAGRVGDGVGIGESSRRSTGGGGFEAAWSFCTGMVVVPAVADD